VVALEIDPANLAIARLREAGAVVLVGDATRPDELRRARAGRASHVVSVCGADAANAQVAANLLELETERPARPVSMFIHVGDPRLYAFLLHLSFSSPGTRLEFFNIYERGARTLLRETASLRKDERPVLVVGAGQLGLAVVSNLAREWYDRMTSSPTLGKLRIYLVDREARNRATLLADSLLVGDLTQRDLRIRPWNTVGRLVDVRSVSRGNTWLDEQPKRVRRGQPSPTRPR